MPQKRPGLGLANDDCSLETITAKKPDGGVSLCHRLPHPKSCHNAGVTDDGALLGLLLFANVTSTDWGRGGGRRGAVLWGP